MVFFAEGKRYRYGFTVDMQRVHSEWLYHARVRETNLFFREGSEFELSSAFKEGKGLTDKTRDNALFLSVVAQFNGNVALSLLEWFRELEVKFGVDGIDRQVTIASLEDEALKEDIISFIKRLDLGIADIEVDSGGSVQISLFPSDVYVFHKRSNGDKADLEFRQPR